MDHYEGLGTPNVICGEESFGTGSDHVREKDGIWAVLGYSLFPFSYLSFLYLVAPFTIWTQ